MTEPFEEIVRYLHEEQGIKLARLAPDARVAQDLGVDGADASELLEHLHVRFGTDFSEISLNWTDYFNHEGISFSLSWLAITLGLAMLGGLIFAWSGAPDSWFPIMILIWAAMVAAFEWLRPKTPLKPVTLAGLEQAVLTGSWPKD